jgi:protein-S-isoprenylcysteine O-methyltransferase Ste14
MVRLQNQVRHHRLIFDVGVMLDGVPASILVIAVTFTTYCVIAPLFKEARFRRIYGVAFANDVSRVPYWVPWPRKRR